VPVTQADVLLKTSESDQTAKDISGAPGTYTEYFSVSPGKRWTLKAIRKDPTAGATMIYLKMKSGGTARAYDALGSTAQTVDGRDIFLAAGGGVGLITTGNVADTSITCRIYYEEEDDF